jgi:hypothetical protein
LVLTSSASYSASTVVSLDPLEPAAAGTTSPVASVPFTSRAALPEAVRWKLSHQFAEQPSTQLR